MRVSIPGPTLSLLLTAPASICAVAAEQPAPAPAQPPTIRESVSDTAGEDPSTFTTIVVTAQRRSERLNDVAMAVSAFDGNALAEVGITNTRQLQNVVPSLTYVATGFNAQPYLRGIGTRSGWAGMESSVATYVDDRYISRPWAAMFDMLDIQRVEVLKGPQGILYGRNAAGGAIRAITKDPGDDTEVEIAGRAGDYDYLTLRILAGGPLSAAMKAQIAYSIEKRDGFATNVIPSGRATADDLDRQSLRAKLLWEIGDRATAKLGTSWWRYTDWIGRNVVAVGVPEANRGAALYGGVTSRERGHFASAIGGDNDMRETAVDLRFDVDLDALRFVSITTYTEGNFEQTFDIDVSSIELLDTLADETSRDTSQEFQLLSAGDQRLQWLAGALYFSSNVSSANVFRRSVSAQPLFPPGTDITQGLQHVDVVAYALYAQGTYELNDRWSVGLGSRWNRETKQAALGPYPNAVTTAPSPFSGQTTWDELTPRASLEYRSRLGVVYLSYARGFKSGGYNYPASIGAVLDPETLDSYEVGWKADFIDERLQLRTAVFFADIQGLQVVRGAGDTFLTENAADADVRGIEIDVDIAFSDNLSVTAAAAFTDSEYTAYTAGVLAPLYGPPYGSVPLTGGLDVHGRSLLRTPDQTLSLGVRYRKQLAARGSIALAASYAYKSDYFFDFSAVPETAWLQQDAHGVLNARLAYLTSDARWEIGLSSYNVTDEVYYDDAVLASAASRVSYADPRTYGIDFKYRL